MKADVYRYNRCTDSRGVVRGCIGTSARPASTSWGSVILDIFAGIHLAWSGWGECYVENRRKSSLNSIGPVSAVVCRVKPR